MLEYISIDLIDPNPWHRSPIQSIKVTDNQIQEFLSHTKTSEILVARSVWDRFQLATGHLHLAIFQQLANLDPHYLNLPLDIQDLNDVDMISILLIENENRHDIDPIQRAQAYQDFLTITHTKLRGLVDYLRTINKRKYISRSKISNTLRLLSLPQKVQQLVAEGELDPSTGKILSSLSDHPSACSEIATHLLDISYNQRDLETAILSLKKLLANQSWNQLWKGLRSRPLSDWSRSRMPYSI